MTGMGCDLLCNEVVSLTKGKVMFITEQSFLNPSQLSEAYREAFSEWACAGGWHFGGDAVFLYDAF